MGLGKTLSIIALIASDKDASAAGQDEDDNVLNSTLIIVPMSCETAHSSRCLMFTDRGYSTHRVGSAVGRVSIIACFVTVSS
jgi:hypothetical protein